jgi:TatD DNase family protein
MFLVDSHCHLDQLDLSPYQGDLSAALLFAKNEGVGHFLCVGINIKDFPGMLSIVKAHPHVSATVGLHPNETDIVKEPTVEELVTMAADDQVVAIGETGLDYYRSEGNLDWQRQRFRHHIQAAKKINKPLIIHSRQAKADTLHILKEEDGASVGGVMHCFTEDLEMANHAMDLGFYISFSGIVTFQNAKEIQKVASEIPLERMLIETDSPYLAPVPFRGKSNTPAYVKYVAEFIAKLRGIDVEEFADITTNNFFRCFKGARR